MSDTQGPPYRVELNQADEYSKPYWVIVGPDGVVPPTGGADWEQTRPAADAVAFRLNAAYSRGVVKGLDEVLDFLCNTATAEAPKTPSATLDWIMLEVNVLKQMHVGSLQGQAARGTLDERVGRIQKEIEKTTDRQEPLIRNSRERGAQEGEAT